MVHLIVSAAAAVILVAGAPADPFADVNPDHFEGLARDDLAAWSYGWNTDKVSGSVVTVLMQARYNTPTPFNGNPTPVAYSIHKIQLDCAARTVTYLEGSNYTASGAFVGPGSPSAARPWTDGTTGFQAFAAEMCSSDWKR
ncbi:MAG TPA: hypothetical protein PLO65_06455 [Caulobacter sp.]|nr:hypothetical protein [Caulobacter sp.]